MVMCHSIWPGQKSYTPSAVTHGTRRRIFIPHEPLTDEGSVKPMIYTPKTKRALKLCFEAHNNQMDKSGIPYVYHPFHVAEQMTDETSTIAALLHDVVEDTPYTMEDVAVMGFGDEVMSALALLTHDETVPYLEYVAMLRSNPVARAVKRVDLIHNSDESRLDEITQKDRERLQKYQAALAILDEAE